MRYYEIDCDIISDAQKEFIEMYYEEKLTAKQIRDRLGDRWWKSSKYVSLTSVKPLYTKELCDRCGEPLIIGLDSGLNISRLPVRCSSCRHNNTINCNCRRCSDIKEKNRIEEFNSKYEDIIVPSKKLDKVDFLEYRSFMHLMLSSIKDGIIEFSNLGLDSKDMFMNYEFYEFVAMLVKKDIIYPTKSSMEYIKFNEEGWYTDEHIQCKYYVNLTEEGFKDLARVSEEFDMIIVQMFCDSLIAKLLTDYTIDLGKKYKVAFDDYYELNIVLQDYMSQSFSRLNYHESMTIGNWIQCIYYTIRSMTIQQVRFNSKSTIENFKYYLDSKIISIPEKDNYNLPTTIKCPKLLLQIIKDIYRFNDSIEKFDSCMCKGDVPTVEEDKEIEDANSVFEELLVFMEEALKDKMSKEDIMKLLDIGEGTYYILVATIHGLVVPVDKGIEFMGRETINRRKQLENDLSRKLGV